MAVQAAVRLVDEVEDEVQDGGCRCQQVIFRAIEWSELGPQRYRAVREGRARGAVAQVTERQAQ